MSADLRNWPHTHHESKAAALPPQMEIAYRKLLKNPVGAINNWDNQILWSGWQGKPWLYRKLTTLFKGKPYFVTERDQIEEKGSKLPEPIFPEGHSGGAWGDGTAGFSNKTEV